MTEKSKRILFLYETLEELMNKSGYKPALEITPLCNPQMSIDELLNILLQKGKYQHACEVMAYSMHRRTGIWWGISLLKALYKEISEKAQEKSNDADSEKEKNHGEALDIKQEESADETTENEAFSEIPSERISNEKAEEIKNAINDFSQKRQAEYDSSVKELEEFAQEEENECQKLMDEAIQKLSPEQKEMYQERVNAVNKLLKHFFGMDQNQLIEFSKQMVQESTEANASNDPAKKEAVASKFAAFANRGQQMSDECQNKLNNILAMIKSASSDENKKAAEEDLKEEKNSNVSLKEQASESEEVPMQDIIKNIRSQAFESVLAWVKEPNDKNSVAAEKIGNKASSYPEGMLALAAYWSFGDLNLSSNMNKTNKAERMIIRVDPSMPYKAINSCIVLAASEDGGYRNPMERYKVFFEIGDKIATGKDDWASEQLKQKMTADLLVQAEHELAALRAKNTTVNDIPLRLSKEDSKKSEDLPAPAYKKWNLE